MLASALSVTRSNSRQQLTMQSRTTLRLSPLAYIGQWLNNYKTTPNNDTFQLPTWLGPILWAAPKKKTSHSKKRMRSSNKGLEQKENIVSCPACGNTKLLHHVCKQCYGEIKQKAKNLEMA